MKMNSSTRKRSIAISDAEWAVMKVLWEADPQGNMDAGAAEAGLTLRQIDEAVKENGWSYSTVRTMVGRLVEKGAITADKTHPGNFLYYPAVSEETCQREEVRSFVDRVFGGSARLLVSALVDEQKLSAEEEAALLAIIDKME